MDPNKQQPQGTDAPQVPTGTAPQTSTPNTPPQTTGFAQPPTGQPTTQPPSVSQPTTPHSPQQPLAPPPEVMQKAAVNDRRRNIKNSIRSFLSFVGFVVTVIIAAALINHFVFQSYYVDGSSMTPTLESDDRLIIDKIGKTIATIQGQPYIPERGQIVVLDSSLLDQYGRSEQLIKRVIGLPGDTITIRDGTVTIKNKEHPEGFNVDQTLNLPVEPTYAASPIQVTIGEGELYVLGDNRVANGSFDSRSFGPITNDKVQGHLAARIFPFDRVQFY